MGKTRKYPSRSFWITGLIVGIAFEYGSYWLFKSTAGKYAGAVVAYIACFGLMIDVLNAIIKKGKNIK